MAFSFRWAQVTATVAGAMFAFSLSAQSPMAARNPMAVRAQARITAQVNNKSRVALAGQIPYAIAGAADQGRLDGDLSMDHMVMLLRGSEEQDQALRTLIDQQNEKASPYYQKWITPEQFGQSFGVADSDVEAVTSWLQSQGLSVEQVTPGKRLVLFSGKVREVEAAFGTQMHRYSVNGVSHISASADITIPSALAPVVRAVPTLHDFFKKSQISNPHVAQFPAVTDANGKTRIAPNASTPQLTSGTTHYFGPIDFQTVYNTKPLISAGIDGTGIKIGVIGRTALGLNDIQTYRSMFGLPDNDPTFTLVGEDPGIVPGDDGENYLDVEVSGGVAPGAKINFIYSKPTLTTDGVDLSSIYAVQSNSVDIITVSFGLCESAFSSAQAQYQADLWAQAAAQGISVFVSSGDNGPASCDSSNSSYSSYGYAVSLLASTPYNVAVGGTMFSEGSGTYWSTTNSAGFGSALSYIPETPWNEAKGSGATGASGLWSGSGGISAYFLRPSWQAGVGIPAGDPAYAGTGAKSYPTTPYVSGVHRLLPDVSLNAAGSHDPTLYCAEGICAVSSAGALQNAGLVGGTSVAAPEMAGVQALIDQANGGRQGNPNFHYYALASSSTTAFNDVTTGNTLVCANSSCTTANKIGWTAGTGYDEATGLGSANGYQLATLWSSVTFNSTVTSLTATPTAGLTHGQNMTLMVTVMPGTGSGTPTGQVAFYTGSGSITNPYSDTTGAFVNQPAYCTLNAGTCTVSLGSLPAGSYNLYARYVGDTTYASSTSAGVPVAIAKENSAITFGVNALSSCTTSAYTTTAASSVTYGTALLLDTKITGVSGQGVATGSFSILDSGASYLTSSLNPSGESELIAGAVASSCELYGYLNPNRPALNAGTHALTVSYGGDSNFNSSTTSNAYTFTINKASLTSALIATSAGIASGGSETLIYRLTPLDASAQPATATGTVTFTDTTTGATLGTASVAAGLYANSSYYLATLTTTGITGATGSHTISATYSGDTNYASTTATSTVTVGPAGTITSSTLTVTTNPQTVGVTNTLTYTATAYSGASPTGTVYFYDGSTLIGSGTLSSAKATLALRAIMTGGTHSLTAVYAGSTTYAGSTSPLLSLVMNQQTIGSYSGTSAYLAVKFAGVLGSTMTATLQMTPLESGSYVPYIPITGTVQFYDNGTAIGAPATPTIVPAASGGYGFYQAYLATTALTTGNHTISAVLNDVSYTVSTNTQTVTINKYTPVLSVASTQSIFGGGVTVPLTATLNVPSTAAAPTGTVSFYDGSTLLGSGSLTGAAGVYTATYSTAALSGGPHSITAVYGGDGNYAGVTSAIATITITTNNVFIGNGNGTLSAVSNGGAAITGSAASGGGTALAVDGSGFVWAVNASGSKVAKFSAAGALVDGGSTVGGLNAPTAVAIDGAGLVWVTNGNGTLTALSAPGTAVSPSAGYKVSASTPTSINIDAAGNVWITNAGDNSVTEVFGAATPVSAPLANAIKNNTLAVKP